MDTTEISSHQELTSLIQNIKVSRDTYDLDLSEKFKELVHNVSPVQIAKSALLELVEDKEVQFDLVKCGLNLGANFIIDSAFNNRNSDKKFLTRAILRNLTTSFIEKNASNIVIETTKFISTISDSINEPKGHSDNKNEVA